MLPAHIAASSIASGAIEARGQCFRVDVSTAGDDADAQAGHVDQSMHCGSSRRTAGGFNCCFHALDKETRLGTQLVIADGDDFLHVRM